MEYCRSYNYRYNRGCLFNGIKLFFLIGIILVCLRYPLAYGQSSRSFKEVQSYFLKKKELLSGHLRVYIDMLNYNIDYNKWRDLCHLTHSNENGYVETFKRIESELGSQPSQLIPFLANIVRHCDYSIESLQTAGDILDNMYWHNSLYLAGGEPPFALGARQVFFDFMNLQIVLIGNTHAEMVRKYNLEYEKVQGPLDWEILTSASSKMMLWNGFYILKPEMRKVMARLSRIMDLRKDIPVLFLKDTLQALFDSHVQNDIQNLFLFLLKANQSAKIRKIQHGGFKSLLKLFDYDYERLFKNLAFFASLRNWPVDYIAKPMIANGSATPSLLKSIWHVSSIYYLLNLVDEKTARPRADLNSMQYHFFYPPGYKTNNWKTYHYYVQAYIGCRLAREEVSFKDSDKAITRISQIYELVNLNRDTPMIRIFNQEPQVRLVLEGYNDVDLNTDGFRYGYKSCNDGLEQ